jgi:deoxyribonuclease V
MELQGKYLHPWDVDLQKAKLIQNELKEYVRFQSFDRDSYIVAGIDVSVIQKSNEAKAAITLMSYPDMTFVDSASVRTKVPFPYIPGFLSFREGPVIFEAWKKLVIEPDLLMFDGQGLAHPRHFGLACHLGVLLNKPSIGCAKSYLYGKMEEPDVTRSSYKYIYDPKDNSILGAVLRTRTNVKPIYISVGNLMDLPSAINIVLSLSPRYRIPDPLRKAHKLSKEGWN